MFKAFIGFCKFCSKDNQVIPVKSGRCMRCNYEFKQAKKKADGKETKKYTYVHKATGEKQIFEEIAKEREHKCFVCGKHLNELTASNFMHVLPKALNKYPKYKLYKKSIILGCHDSYSSCHHRYDKEPRSTLTEPMWLPIFELETKLKKQYPNVI